MNPLTARNNKNKNKNRPSTSVDVKARPLSSMMMARSSNNSMSSYVNKGVGALSSIGPKMNRYSIYINTGKA